MARRLQVAAITLVAAASLLLACVLAVDRSKFRTCASTGFCTAYRNVPGPALFEEPAKALALESNGLVLRNQFISLECLASGAIRVRIEKGEKRWQSDQTLVDTTSVQFKKGSGEGQYDCGSSASVTFEPSTTKLSFTRPGETKPFMVLNERGMTYIELPSSATELPGVGHTAPGEVEEARRTEERKIVDWGEDGKPIYEGEQAIGGHKEGGSSEEKKDDAASPPQPTDAPTTSRAASETWGGFTDSKPKGPMSVGFDATFYAHGGKGMVSLHGLPEHASAFSLKDTDGSNGAYSEPFRLYNLDVFEYELDEPMSLYGAVPYVLSRDASDRFSGLFFNNPSEVFVDISTSSSGGRSTRWVAETGVLEMFVYSGPSMAVVLEQHTRLTGRAQLPPIFSLGYHQCRWNYRDQKDVEEVHAKFEELDFPVDVLWLDIEHTDGKRYFTWDKTKFPDPVQMQLDLGRTGRRLVTIVDPHVKRDPEYFVHKNAEKNGYYLKDGSADFEGWCWPGSSSYPDFTSPQVRSWWGDYYTMYEGATDRLSIWIDMNEMSVFNGPEVTIKKTATSLEGIENRDWHNLYGFYYHLATFEGLKKARRFEQRPFILTRSFFAGTQRLGAIWNGDNKADWTHLRITAPMLLSMSISGLNFVGADVGGFFGNPEPELLVRWYESGAFQPFFRAHAHIETKRREPWMFGDEVLSQIRQVVMDRYRHLAYIYSAFEEAHRTGMSVMRPVFGAFSEVALEDAWLLGSDLLVMPILHQGLTKLTVQDVPHQGEFVDFASGKKVLKGAAFDAPLGKTPLFQRVGSIIPKQMRLRRSSEQMIRDPYTLFVAVDAKGNAKGSLYLDDQLSYAFEKGQSMRVEFIASGCSDVDSSKCKLEGRVITKGNFSPVNKLERVIFSSAGASITKVGCVAKEATAEQAGSKSKFAVECNSDEGLMVWRKPWVDLAKDFVLFV